QDIPSPQALVDKAQAEAKAAKEKAEAFAKEQAEKAKELAKQAEKAVDKVAPMVKDAVPAGLKQEGGFLKTAEASIEKVGKGLMEEIKPIAKTGLDLAKGGAVKAGEIAKVAVGDVSKMAKEAVPEVKKIVDSFGKPNAPEIEKMKMEEMKKMGVPPPKDAKDMEDLRKGIYRPEGKEVPGTGLLESLQKDLAALQSMLGKLLGAKASGYTSGELFGSTNSLILIALVVAIIIASRR
ncbi:hypothetical protein EBT31_05320, partial [bacterium]|nr:hypothetical protein [bacterium]